MLLSPESLVIDAFCSQLEQYYHLNYGDTEIPYGEVASWAARLSLENIANSDMLYHDLEHTVMVTVAGQSILHGKQLIHGGISAEDWLHCTLAMLFHDIGYCKGICRADSGNNFVISESGESIELPETATDAQLTPYHVDRGKVFVRERFGRNSRNIDVDRIARYIEMTRFPVPADEVPDDPDGLGVLVRAADMLGQLGDPSYLNKIPALFFEFEQLGWNKKFNYETPWDLRHNYSGFYWNQANPHIEPVMPYLKATQDGRQWIANLHAHVFSVEHLDAPSPNND